MAIESMTAAALPASSTAPKMQMAALWYTDQGFHVHPCRTNKKPYLSNGFKGASTDPETIRNWFEQFPDLQLGIWCDASNIVVIDVDDEEAFREFLDVNGHDLPATRRVRTPSGGVHHYYRCRPGAVYPDRLWNGVDVRWRGYVLAPPSSAYSKKAGGFGQYRLINGASPIAEAPTWLEKREVTETPLHPRLLMSRLRRLTLWSRRSIPIAAIPSGCGSSWPFTKRQVARPKGSPLSTRGQSWSRVRARGGRTEVGILQSLRRGRARNAGENGT